LIFSLAVPEAVSARRTTRKKDPAISRPISWTARPELRGKARQTINPV
jgi:hypothetical protein